MERFYHIRAQKAGLGQVLNNGGATVQLSNIDGDPLHIRLRVAYCNPKDVFDKKTGRSVCTGRPAHDSDVTRRDPLTGTPVSVMTYYPPIPEKEWKTIPIRLLPAELGRIYRHVHHKMKEQLIPGEHRSFESRLREWLPKE